MSSAGKINAEDALEQVLVTADIAEKERKKMAKKMMKKEKMKAWLYAIAELVVIVNAVLAAKEAGPLPFEQSDVIEWGSYILGFAGFIHACWKNHNWTPAAIKAQEFLRGFKEDGFGGEENA